MNDRLGLADGRLLICLGPGGVGKTTVSAALALGAACAGRAVEVITIDPAPRLLDALGLRGDSGHPVTVDLDALKPAAGGRLRAMRLDPKRTFDAIVERYAPSPAARDAILSGRIYQNLSNSLAGVADYMAIEQLLELYQNNGHGLIVLDTPPAQAALDFLDAPRRMGELIRSRAITLLGGSRGLLPAPFKLLDAAARMALSAFDRLTGLHLLADVQDFVRAFEGMYDGFAARAADAERLMHDDRTALALVTTAQPDRIAAALRFAEALGQRGFRLAAIVVNRTIGALPARDAIEQAKLPAGLKRKLRRNLEDFAALQQRETAAITRLQNGTERRIELLAVADLEREPQSLAEFLRAAESLRAVGARAAGVIR